MLKRVGIGWPILCGALLTGVASIGQPIAQARAESPPRLQAQTSEGLSCEWERLSGRFVCNLDESSENPTAMSPDELLSHETREARSKDSAPGPGAKREPGNRVNVQQARGQSEWRPAPNSDRPREPRDGALAKCLEDLKPGLWTDCGTDPIPLIDRDDVPHDNLDGVEGPPSVITAWNGAALTPEYMIFHGGGHRAYGGNEVYGFDYHNLEWGLLTPPYGVPEGDDPADYTWEDFCQDPYPDGTPNSRHTYGGITYVPWTDSVWKFSGIGYCHKDSEQPAGLDVWEYDLKRDGRAAWTHHGKMAWDIFNHLKPNISVKATPWEAEKKIAVFGRNGKALYDPATGTWEEKGSTSAWLNSGHITNYGDDAFVYYDNKRIWVTRDNPLTLDNGLVASDGSWGSSAATAWHPGKQKVVVWNGGREIRTWEPESDTWTQYPNPDGPSPGRTGPVYNKFFYLYDYDVFMGYASHKQGVWFYRLPDEPRETEQAALEAQGFTCSDDILNWECQSIQRAVDRAPPGSVIAMPKGIYTSGAKIEQGVTVDMQGSRIEGAVIAGRGAFWHDGGDFMLRNVTITGSKGGSGNEAGVRAGADAGNLTLQNVTIRDSYNGILSTSPGVTRIEDSLIEGNGCCSQVRGKPAGRSHGVYIRDGAALEIVKSTFGPGAGKGHLVKTGTAQTIIESSVLDERGGNQSRTIDAFNGGEVILRTVTIHARSDDGNSEIIGYGMEDRTRHGVERLLFDNVTVHCDNRSRLVSKRRKNLETTGLEDIEWPEGQC